MAIVTIIAAIIAAVLLLSELLCGLWIRKNNDESGKKFHLKLGIAATISGLITSLLTIILAS